MHENSTDNQLWDLIKEGDKEALSQLFHRYYFVLVKAGLQSGFDSELSRDTASEVFFNLWKNRFDLAVVNNVRAYLSTIYRNSIYTHVRNLNRQMDKHETWLETEEFHQLSYEEILVRLQLKEEQKEALRVAFEKLTPRQKEYLQLKFFEGFSYEQISEKTGQTIKTVYNTTYEALKILRQKISL